jgi:hypothetical protein
MAARLDVGTIDVSARWLGTPDGPLADLVNITAPRPTTTNASGFVTFDAKPLFANAPPLPIGGGVSLDQLGASLAGPITAIIPSGSVDIQIRAPLIDPKPAQTIVENCTASTSSSPNSKHPAPAASCSKARTSSSSTSGSRTASFASVRTRVSLHKASQAA